MAVASGRDAVVIGAGIGGLSAAVALRRIGWRVTVLEQAPRIGAVGAGLSLMANALRALDSIGLRGAVTAAGGTGAEPAVIRRPDGRILLMLDDSVPPRSPDMHVVGIHRAALHRILHDALTAGSVLTGAEAVSVRPGTAGDGGAPAEVSYRHGGGTTTVQADLVVAADGIHSTVRRQLWPHAPAPVHAGSMAWRAVIEWDAPLAIALTWGRGAEFGIVPIGSGQVYWYGAVNATPGGTAGDELAAVRDRFGSWHAPIPALLDATDPEVVLRNDIYHLGTPLPSYVSGRVALLGDAAHAMTPYLGQGAGQSIEDAVVLAACLGGATGTGEALARYDRLRRPRTQAVARAALQAGRFGQQLEHPVAIAARNALVRLVPRPLVARDLTRYTRWTPPALPARV